MSLRYFPLRIRSFRIYCAFQSSVVFWWIFIWGSTLSVCFSGKFIYEEDFTYTRLGAAVYVALAKNLFVSGIALGIFGVSHGIGCTYPNCHRWFRKFRNNFVVCFRVYT